ncbi:MAG: hypothetical protein IT546_17020 [Caulobacteraceae bacterium]|nr:hypothetical protein [Caulobacteraceae bacterium]
MGAQVVSLFQRPAPLRDWSQQELAEFYRVENALIQAGMRIETDRGVTDDGEPWFAFCREDDGEVFIHFARIGGQYIIASSAYEGVIKGWDFASLVRELIARHPLVQLGPARRPTNLFMHPAALLIAVVGTAFFKTGEAKADDGSDSSSDGGRRLMLPVSGGVSVKGAPAASIAVEAHQTLTLVASAMAAAAAFHAPQTAGVPEHGLLDRLASGVAPLAPAAADIGLETLAAPAAAARGGAILPTAALPAAEEVASWLSLTVILRDVAGAPGPASEAMTIAPSQASALDLPAAPAPAEVAAQPASPWLMLVDLAPGPLPDVAAVRLVQDMGLLDRAPVLHVTELPQVLIDFINGGQHIPVAPETAPDQAETPAAPPETDAGLDLGGIVDDGHSVDVTPIITAPVETAPTSPPLLETTPPGADPQGPPPPASHGYTDADIQEAIDHFMQYTSNVQIVANGDQIVLVDQWIKHGLLAQDKVETVTYTFEDGSTISLIGSHFATHDPDLFAG